MDFKTMQGRNVGFEMSSALDLNPAEREALNILDRECEGGPGGTWYVVRKLNSLVANPNGPFESVIFNKTKQAWEELDDYLADQEVEEEDEDELSAD